MKKKILKVFLILFLVLWFPVISFSNVLTPLDHPVMDLVGESLRYDISFLWFDTLAEGSLQLLQGEQEGTFHVILEAKTLGVAAFFTRDRVEKYQTLMEIGPSGLLQPLWHSSHTIRGSRKSRKEKITRYTYDYSSGRVRYERIKNGRQRSDKWFDMDEGEPLFDILSALYNLRLGFFGQSGEEIIEIPTFHRKGTQKIVVKPLLKLNKKDKKFFAGDAVQCRILVDPEVFGTKGRDVFASFDFNMRPQKGIIKDVIGMGDVKGTLRTP